MARTSTASRSRHARPARLAHPARRPRRRQLPGLRQRAGHPDRDEPHRRVAGRVHLLPPLRAPHLGRAGQRPRPAGRPGAGQDPQGLTAPAGRRAVRARAGRAPPAVGSPPCSTCSRSVRSSRPTTSAAWSPTSSTRRSPDAVGAAFVRVVGAAGARIVVGHDMRPSSPELVAAFAAGANAQGADVIDIGLASTDQLYFASGSLDLPGAMFTASHNPARYNGIKLCRAGAEPVGPGHRAGRDPGPGRARAARAADGAAGHGRRARDLLPGYAAYLRELVDLSGHPPAEGRRRRRQRHGRAHRPDRARRACRSTSCRCTSSSTARSPTTRPTRSTRRTCVDLQARVRETAPTSAWPSTATPTAASSSTSAASRSRRRRVTALVAVRELARDPGRDGDPQPDHLARGRRRSSASTAARRSAPGSGTPSSRPRWRGPARSSAASTRRTTTSATSGAPTPACSRRCTCSRRWASRTGRCRELAGEYDALRRVRRDQQRGGRPGRAAAERVRAAYAGRAGVDDGRARRADRRRPGLVVQPARVQHRAAAAAQRRGGRPTRRWTRCATRCSRWSRHSDRQTDRAARPPRCWRSWPARSATSPLRAERGAEELVGELVCTGCGLAYPVRDDIPVLLVDEAPATAMTEGEPDDGRPRRPGGARRRRPRRDAARGRDGRRPGTRGAAPGRRGRGDSRWSPRTAGRAPSSSPAWAAPGIAGDVAGRGRRPACPVPVVPHRGYRLPGWVGPMDLVIAVSCSGPHRGDAVGDRRGAAPGLPRGHGRRRRLAARGPRRRRPCRAPAGRPHGRMPRANLWGLAVPALLVPRRASGWPTSRGACWRAPPTQLDADRRALRARRRQPSTTRPRRWRSQLAGSLPYVWGSERRRERGGGRTVRPSSPRTRSTRPSPARSPRSHHNQVVVLAGVFGAGGAVAEDDIFRDRVDDGPGAPRLRLLVLRDTEEHPQVAPARGGVAPRRRGARRAESASCTPRASTR